jgi:hypothetical protein
MDLIGAARATRTFIKDCGIEVLGEDATSSSHLYDMLDAIEQGTVTDNKAHRWLGWAQGVICCRGGASLDQLKEINK